MGRSIAGWKIGPEERDRLLARFPPRYERRVADHVTLRFGTDADTPLPAETEEIGRAHVELPSLMRNSYAVICSTKRHMTHTPMMQPHTPTTTNCRQ